MGWGCSDEEYHEPAVDLTAYGREVAAGGLNHDVLLALGSKLQLVAAVHRGHVRGFVDGVDRVQQVRFGVAQRLQRPSQPQDVLVTLGTARGTGRGTPQSAGCCVCSTVVETISVCGRPGPLGQGHGWILTVTNHNAADQTWPSIRWEGGGGGRWHKALVVGSVNLWRRLLASRL